MSMGSYSIGIVEGSNDPCATAKMGGAAVSKQPCMQASQEQGPKMG